MEERTLKRKRSGQAAAMADYGLDLTGLNTPWLSVTSLSEEAVAWFHTALEHDPSFAMAHWGAALVHGPNYNNFGSAYYGSPTTEKSHQGYPSLWEGQRHAREAMRLMEGCSTVQQELIRAIQSRYEDWDISRCDHLELRFANAMRKVWSECKPEPNVAAVLAAALMNLSPWQLWQEDKRDDALMIKRVTETALAVAPEHPGLCHLYVHLMEMSSEPAAAVPQCNVLRQARPNAAHLLHMPAHIDVQIGSYQQAMQSSEAAIAADQRLVAAGKMGSNFGYMLHDFDMAIYAAMLAGCESKALEYYRQMMVHLPEQFVLAEEWPEVFQALRYDILVRFGCWEEILKEELLTNQHVFVTCSAMQRYARGVALATTGDVEGAQKEAEAFDVACREPELKGRSRHIVSAAQSMKVAQAVLGGEILYRKGTEHHQGAFEQLRKAVQLDDGLPYDEPWGWMMPARHPLGALMLEAGEVASAAEVYRDDLAPGKHPLNVWSLTGLKQCLEAMSDSRALSAGEEQELAVVGRQIQELRRDGVGVVSASCACATNYPMGS